MALVDAPPRVDRYLEFPQIARVDKGFEAWWILGALVSDESYKAALSRVDIRGGPLKMSEKPSP
jgi:hypothetical protein